MLLVQRRCLLDCARRSHDNGPAGRQLAVQQIAPISPPTTINAIIFHRHEVGTSFANHHRSRWSLHAVDMVRFSTIIGGVGFHHVRRFRDASSLITSASAFHLTLSMLYVWQATMWCFHCAMKPLHRLAAQASKVDERNIRVSCQAIVGGLISFCLQPTQCI